MKDIFITPKEDEDFASISEDLIQNDEIRFIFPKGKYNLMCYKINRKELLKLVKEKKISYNWYNEISFEKYKDYFEKISIFYANILSK